MFVVCQIIVRLFYNNIGHNLAVFWTKNWFLRIADIAYVGEFPIIEASVDITLV